MLVATSFNIGNDLQEEIQSISDEYPCWTCYEQFDLHPDGIVPWHWHPEVELTLVLEGRVRVLINHEEIFLEPGDGMFTNSNVLHYKEPASEGKVSTVNHIFDPTIVAGQYNSVFALQYVKPLVECPGFNYYVFRGCDTDNSDAVFKIKHAYDVTYQNCFGYEMIARNDFSDIWLSLYDKAKDKISEKNNINTLKEERVKYMMMYIQKNFADKLSLEEIASSANISKRECLRCFHEVLSMTPFHYLMDFRVRKAADLLRNTNLDISEIGYTCGFSGTSYFTKLFRESKGMTPSQYRKTSRQEK